MEYKFGQSLYQMVLIFVVHSYLILYQSLYPILSYHSSTVTFSLQTIARLFLSLTCLAGHSPRFTLWLTAYGSNFIN